MSIVFYIGTTFDLEEYKIRIIEKMLEQEMILVSRTDFKYDLPKVKQEYIYSDQIFSKDISDDDILNAEKELGIPFDALLRYWYNWKGRKATKEHYKAITRYVIYWKDFFSKNRPSFFISTYESTFPEIVSVEMAKKIGVPVVFIAGGRMSNSLIFCDENFNPICWKSVERKEQEETFSMLKKRYETKVQIEGADIKKDIEKYSDYSIKNIGYKLGRLRKYLNNYNSLAKIDKLRFISPYELVRKYITGQIRTYGASFMYKKNIELDKTDYFFFPLHFSDEANISFLENALDQFDIIKRISKSLPRGYLLLVKPHPHYRCRDIPLGKLRELAKLRNVRLLHPDISPYAIIKRAKGVCIISSTTGYEALILGKPVVAFGHDALFSDEKAVNVVHDLKELPDTIMRIVSGVRHEEENAIKKTVTSYYKNLIFLEGKVGMNNIHLTEGDAKKIADTLVSYMNSAKR